MKIPLVVIVGRPNVGKSTLFNRLTKSKDAIVDDLSGVTRDRLYGEVEWNARRFQLIDTGGYVPDSDELFETAIREQVEIAVQEADAILFVTDGRVGVNPVDNEIARMLRTSKKNSFLLVNKSDNEDLGLNKSEFYSLGLEHVYDVSALSGRNIGDVLDELVKLLPEVLEDEEEDTRLRLSILGQPNVGKSSITNSLLGYNRSIVTDIPGTTRDSIDSVLKYYGEEIVLVDTAGLRKKTKVNESIEFYSNVRAFRAIAGSDVSILMIDATAGLEKQDQKIIDEIVRRRNGLIIAINKWDLIEKDTNTAREYEKELKLKLGSVDYAPIIFVSALTKQRIYKIIDIAKEIHTERKKKIQTSELNDVLLEEIQKTPPPTTPIGKEIKIKYITQVGSKYPIFLFFANDVKYIPDQYRRFLEKTIRKNFGFSGVPMTISFKNK
ncbi:MAG: ribosome biogenesis GTPase Der [Ignavibacteria bacterium]|jgi:GTP-binding protein